MEELQSTPFESNTANIHPTTFVRFVTAKPHSTRDRRRRRSMQQEASAHNRDGDIHASPLHKRSRLESRCRNFIKTEDHIFFDPSAMVTDDELDTDEQYGVEPILVYDNDKKLEQVHQISLPYQKRVLEIDDLLGYILGFISWKEQVRCGTLVSQHWRRVVHHYASKQGLIVCNVPRVLQPSQHDWEQSGISSHQWSAMPKSMRARFERLDIHRCKNNNNILTTTMTLNVASEQNEFFAMLID